MHSRRILFEQIALNFEILAYSKMKVMVNNKNDHLSVYYLK
jgi:hypothetical protein